jgi:hypothetical protein
VELYHHYLYVSLWCVQLYKQQINFVMLIKTEVLFFVIRFFMSAISVMLYGAIRKI